MSERLELLDYITFFEAEPTILNPDIGWTVGAQFDSVRGEHRILATVAPDDVKFSFQWWENGLPRVDLSLQGVTGWKIDARPGNESLLLKFHQEGIEYFIVQLKPYISVSCVTR